MNKLFARERVDAIDAMTSMLIACSECAIDKGLSIEDLVLVFGGAVEHFAYRKGLIHEREEIHLFHEVRKKPIIHYP